ncbi:MAG: PA2778 family cysteine peptidase [Betaproteobacteria bacterium]|nr:PA2778 family cysteine peptidase [Betaproteobacteria bacterium]
MHSTQLRRALLGAIAVLLAGCAARAPVLLETIPDTGPRSVEIADAPFFPQEDYQCGPAALATVLGQSGVNVTPAALAPQVYLPQRKGSLQIELIAATRRHGRVPVIITPELSALVAELQAGRPVLVLQNLRLQTWPQWHYAVVVGYDAQRDVFLLRSGRAQRLEATTAEFLRTWRLGRRWGMVTLVPGELPASSDPRRYLEAVAAMETVADSGTLTTAYRAALARWPQNFAARFGLANALRSSGELAAADVIYRSLLIERPDEPAVVNNLADLLVESGCPDEAVFLLDRVLANGAGGALGATLKKTRAEALAAPDLPGGSCSAPRSVAPSRRPQTLKEVTGARVSFPRRASAPATTKLP